MEASRLLRQVVNLFQSPDQSHEVRSGSRLSENGSETRPPASTYVNQSSATLSSSTVNLNSDAIRVARPPGPISQASEGICVNLVGVTLKILNIKELNQIHCRGGHPLFPSIKGTNFF